MAQQIIARGKVIEHPSTPFAYCIADERYGWLWPVPTWAMERRDVHVGQTLVISLEEPEKELDPIISKRLLKALA